MPDPIHIGRGLRLPTDVVTQTIAILAKRRAGKSYTARRIVEQLYAAGQQVVVVDPKGDWYGIRSSADGKGDGLPLIIFGGEHGDVPLEPGGGELVARLVVEQRVSVVLDLSLLRSSQLAQFMASFLSTLYRLKAQDRYRTPCMVAIDEADVVAPQKPREKGHVPVMLGAAEDLVRRGGQRGLGCMLVSQRAAVLNKNVLTQAGMLVALQTIAPQDLKALGEWIDVHGSPEERKLLMGSLPSLEIGEAWFWAPAWPTHEGIFKRVRVGRIATFDSGATPRVGARPVEVRGKADVDLEALKVAMAETLERQAADDPKALRRRIASLERDLARAAEPSREAEEVREQRDQAVAQAVALREQLEGLVGSVEARLVGAIEHLREAAAEAPPVEIRSERPSPERTPPRKRSAAPSPARPSRDRPEGLTGPQKRILDALAWWRAIDASRVPTRVQVAMVAGYSARSSGFKNPLSSLQTAGYVVYPQPGSVVLTDAGLEVADAPPRPPTRTELHDRVREILSGPQRRILDPLLEVWPDDLSRADLADRAGYSPGSSGFKNPLASLKSLGLVAYPGEGFARAEDVLFP